MAYEARKAGGEPKRQIEQVKVCEECGAEFTTRMPHTRWCSALCRSRFTHRVASRRRGPISAEPYADREIFERDGWKCYLCGEPVNRDARRTDPDGATIDHIIPISLGGQDARSNVATTHSRCNRAKRNVLLNPEELAKQLVAMRPDLVAAELEARRTE